MYIVNINLGKLRLYLSYFLFLRFVKALRFCVLSAILSLSVLWGVAVVMVALVYYNQHNINIQWTVEITRSCAIWWTLFRTGGRIHSILTGVVTKHQLFFLKKIVGSCGIFIICFRVWVSCKVVFEKRTCALSLTNPCFLLSLKLNFNRTI